MKISKSILINGVLFLGAILSWTIFLKKLSPAQQNADHQALKEWFLTHAFADIEITDVQLYADPAEDHPALALSSLAGSSVVPDSIGRLGAFIGEVCRAHKATAVRDWHKIGEIHILGKAGPDTKVIAAYETPAGWLGFETAGQFYISNNVPAEVFLGLIHPKET